MPTVSDSEIVWSPRLTEDALSILLHSNFAAACRAQKPEHRAKITEVTWQLMGNTLPVIPSNFLDYDEGILIKGIYAGRDGLWLTRDGSTLTEDGRALLYHGHNEDRHSSDRLWLLRAFGMWVRSARTAIQVFRP
jgi:hypothetical protein